MGSLHSATVNDVHSRLNKTCVAGIFRPASLDELIDRVRQHWQNGRSLCISGGRHAMGGQQFASDHLLLDTRDLDRLDFLDPTEGTATFEAGAQWPGVIRQLHAAQPEEIRWSIRQKQTGADDLTLGGAVSANVHGRGLLMAPIVEDVESLDVLCTDGEVRTCSRNDNATLFSLIVGGYGLFGVILKVTLRLAARQLLTRRVDVLDVDDALSAVRRRADEGCIYGDFQYAIAPNDRDFLRRGVCACYAPAETGDATEQRSLTGDDWASLMSLAATDKPKAFAAYAQHYLATHGQTYWSDEMQLSAYLPSYDQFLRRNNEGPEATLMIGEQYVPPETLLDFLEDARSVLRKTQAEDFYGTIRTIQPDTETVLPWAREHFACIIFNLHTTHDNAGVDRSAAAFRALNDASLAWGGSFFLTYHRWSTREQIEAAYPRFGEFLQHKLAHDPSGLITSDWHRHHVELFA